MSPYGYTAGETILDSSTPYCLLGQPSLEARAPLLGLRPPMVARVRWAGGGVRLPDIYSGGNPNLKTAY